VTTQLQLIIIIIIIIIIIVIIITKGNEKLYLNWQKKSWQTFEVTSGCVRPEQVNKWPNSMTDI
jgi:hypothetical protein